MAKVRITKRFHFEMAHALLNYDGRCRNIHGHSYNLQVTCIGKAQMSQGDPKDGMLIDFGELKTIVNTWIVDRFDHALMINSHADQYYIDRLKETSDRVLLVDFQPTSENIVAYIASLLQQHLPEGVKLYSVRLYETITSFAEWFADDNS